MVVEWRICLPVPETQAMQFQSLSREGPREKKWQPTPAFFLGKSHGQRSLVGYSPWVLKGLDMSDPLRVCTHTRTHARTHTHTYTV